MAAVTNQRVDEGSDDVVDLRVNPSDGGPSVIALGNFDGVHLGHAALCARARDLARPDTDTASRALMLTFSPHPSAIVAPARTPARLTTSLQRRALVARLGLDGIIEQCFDSALSSLTPTRFARDILSQGLNAVGIVVGHGFRFGFERAGDTKLLAELGAELGFWVECLPPVLGHDGVLISSSRIRSLITSGDATTAARLLGRPYALEGVIVHGAQRGRQLGYPTANLGDLARRGQVLPAVGIYAGSLDWGRGPRLSAISVGHNPTFGHAAVTVEAYVLPEASDEGEGEMNLYDHVAEVAFHARLRDERAFDNITALVDQIAADVEAARSMDLRFPAHR